MSKELIFMGRSNGKVRLALFDGGHGAVRKLPIKEITESVFVAGIKSGNLPVRGFSVERGRIVCQYGNWYTLPEVTNDDGLSIFGTVSFSEQSDILEKHSFDCETTNIEPVFFCGLASINWSDGTFRVLSPSTVLYLQRRKETLIYMYGGKLKRKQLSEIDADRADYIYSECEVVETLDEVCAWMGDSIKTAYTFLQWIYQKCEYAGANKKYQYYITNYMTNADQRIFDDTKLSMMGTKPLSLINIPDCGLTLRVRNGRNVGLIDTGNAQTVTLYGLTNSIIKCDKLQNLQLSRHAYAKLIRSEDSVPLTVRSWNGWKGSGGDYRGLNIESLVECFVSQTADRKLIFDTVNIRGCFRKITADVEFTQELKNLCTSFSEFNGSLKWKGVDNLQNSFFDCQFTSPLDLRNIYIFNQSVNRVQAEFLLPKEFEVVTGVVFVDTNVEAVSVRIDEVNKRNIFITNERLSLEVSVLGASSIQFDGCCLARLCINGADGMSLQFRDMAILPDTAILTGVNSFSKEAFDRVAADTLDLRVFPNVTELPSEMAIGCSFSTVIIGDNIKKISDRVFVGCREIRWVYISSAVSEIKPFIKRPRIDYTIFTQRGSCAEKFAKKNNITVRYADSVDDFMRATQEVPEELETAVTVSFLSGRDDGESSAVELACSPLGIASDLYEKYPIRKTCSIPLKSIEWASLPTGDTVVASYPRQWILLSYLTHNTESYLPIKDIGAKNVKTYQRGWYSCGDYSIGYAVLDTATDAAEVIWLVVEGETVVHMFTEKVAKLGSCTSVMTMIKEANRADVSGCVPTNISSVLKHIDFINDGIAIRGKRISRSVYQTFKEALFSTFVPVGVYSSGSKGRCFVGIDIATLETWEFRLVQGKMLEWNSSAYFRPSFWNHVQDRVSGAEKIEKIVHSDRLHSELEGANEVISYLLCVETEKNEDYDTTLPEKEIEAWRVILRAYEERNNDEKTVTVAEFKSSLLASGVARTLPAKAWEKLYKQIEVRNFSNFQLALSDGECRLVGLGYMGWVEFVGSTGAIAIALQEEELFVHAYKLLGVYDNLPGLLPTDRVEHFSHVNCLLPWGEFHVLRTFQSGGLVAVWGIIDVSIAISKVSGKVCVVASCRTGLVPIFWFNTIKDALRILELCGVTGFNYKTEHYIYSSSVPSLCDGVFSTKEAFELGIPDFLGFCEVWKKTRDALRCGERKGFLCVKGKQEIFDLALKHPPVFKE